MLEKEHFHSAAAIEIPLHTYVYVIYASMFGYELFVIKIRTVVEAIAPPTYSFRFAQVNITNAEWQRQINARRLP